MKGELPALPQTMSQVSWGQSPVDWLLKEREPPPLCSHKSRSFCKISAKAPLGAKHPQSQGPGQGWGYGWVCNTSPPNSRGPREAVPRTGEPRVSWAPSHTLLSGQGLSSSPRSMRKGPGPALPLYGSVTLGKSLSISQF